MTVLIDADLRPGRGTVGGLLDTARTQADEGIEHMIINLPDAHRTEQLEVLGRELIPDLAAIRAPATA